VKRREFLNLLGGAAVASPFSARAQQPSRIRRIGVLMPFSAGDAEGQTLVAALRKGLQEFDWTEGRNIAIDFRWSDGDVERAGAHAKELVALSPELIFAFTAGQLAAVARETKTIPIVFVGVSDAVGSGLVASLARPGGNITGFILFEASLGGKWLEALKEVTPRLARVAIMMNPETATGRGIFYVKAFETAATAFSVEPTTAPVRSVGDIKAAIGALGEEPDSGLVVVPDTFTEAHRELIVALAARHRVPAVYPFRHFAMNGGLMSYGPDTVDTFRRSAAYVDRILKGEKPSDLPVQAPTKYALVINLRTAKALGLTVPLIMQMTADEVIE
jgi:putative ABC transport system substrate-binding protein